MHSLELQLQIFEKKYDFQTNTFIKKYEPGILGDDIDYVE